MIPQQHSMSTPLLTVSTTRSDSPPFATTSPTIKNGRKSLPNNALAGRKRAASLVGSSLNSLGMLSSSSTMSSLDDIISTSDSFVPVMDMTTINSTTSSRRQQQQPAPLFIRQRSRSLPIAISKTSSWSSPTGVTCAATLLPRFLMMSKHSQQSQSQSHQEQSHQEQPQQQCCSYRLDRLKIPILDDDADEVSPSPHMLRKESQDEEDLSTSCSTITDSNSQYSARSASCHQHILDDEQWIFYCSDDDDDDNDQEEEEEEEDLKGLEFLEENE